MLPIIVPIVAGALGVVVTTFLLKPYLKYRELLHQISFILIVEGGIIMSLRYSDAPDENRRVLREIRNLAAQLRLSKNRLLQSLHLIPPQNILVETAGRMFRIANRMFEDKKPTEEMLNDTTYISEQLGIDVGSWHL